MKKSSTLNLDLKQKYSEQTLDKVEQILSLEKTQRTKEDINFLYDTFGKLNYFYMNEKKFGIECVRNFMKCMKYKEADEGTVLMEIGEIGTNCYFLIQGAVEVLVPKYGKIEHTGGNMTRINVICDGTVFGEKALIDKQKR
jgi:hypothetical protein